jgi:hypothetical protein
MSLLPVPVKARPPTSATRQQQKIRMLKQVCAVFNRHIPATENTWRPRKAGETHEDYRLRVVEKGDGDLFRGWQVMEAALRSRSRQLLALLPLPPAVRAALDSGGELAERVRVRLPGDPTPWTAYPCRLCRLPAVAHTAEAAGDLCDICGTIFCENNVWAPHMPCKEPSKKRKKKKKKKKKRKEGTDPMLPSPEELLQMVRQERPPAKRARPEPQRFTAHPLGMDLKPDQTLRPTLQGAYQRAAASS